MRVTHDYPIAAARAFAGLAAPASFNFVYVSSEGYVPAPISPPRLTVLCSADPAEKAYALYCRIKGRTETHLLALPTSNTSLAPLCVYNVRPGWVDPSASGGFHRPRGLAMRLLTDVLVAPVMRATMPNMVSPTADLARVLLDLALGDGQPLQTRPGIEAGGRTVRGSAIRRWHEIWGAGQQTHAEL